MAIIRVKRSGSTGSPSALAQGEMAYSFLSGTQSNGGDRLYIGTGTETGGVAANIEVIGGKYFTSKLNHVPGTLVGNSAVIVDSTGKINTLNITALTVGSVSANSSVGAAGQVLTSNGSSVYWSTPASGASSIQTLTIGTGLTGTSYNGSANVTIAIDSTVATLTGSQTLSSKTLDNTNTVTVKDSLFIIQDDVDNTKQVQFQAAGLTTGTTVTLTVPNASGTLATLNGLAQTFQNSTTFSSTALTFGTNVASSTIGIGTGATTTGNTKAINIGIAGTSGSTTNVVIGSAVSGALGTLTINSPTTTFGSTATSLDSAATFAAFGSATALTFGYSGTAASTTNLSTGATANATTKTINIGTGGAAGSTTNINFGSSSGAGTATFNNDLVVTGNLTVNGTTVTMNTTTLTVDDINIELGSVATPTDTTANGGGITLKGTTDKTISWSTANGWTSSETFNLASGKTYKISGADVLSATTLGSGVIGSSLTSVGTITSGTWSASFGAVSGANLTNLTAGNLTGTIPSTVLSNSTVYVGTTAIALNRASGNLGLLGITSIAMPGGTSGTVTLIPATDAGTTSITIPATSGTLVTTGDTGTVTSTMIADGTIVNGDISASAAIAITKLAASTISGVSLGNSLNALTIGTGLSGGSYNGSAGVTIAANLATTSSVGVASFDSTSFSVTSGAVSISAIDGGTY